MPGPWFDAHLDLAYLAVCGRDMLAPLPSGGVGPTMGPHAPAAITLPSLAEGRVRLALGTIFTEPGGKGPEGYPIGDTDRAHQVGRAQLEAYLTWRDRNLISLDLRRVLAGASGRGLGEVRAGMGVAEVVPLTLAARLARIPRDPPLHLGILIEGADPIRSPDHLPWWHDRGVVAIGLTWAVSSRFAAGNADPDRSRGLTDLGRALVREIDRLGIVHDASHLSDRAFDELLDATDRPVIASHSNSRAIVDPTGANQRHLTDSQIARIASRGGVIGLNLFSKFIDPALDGDDGRASISACIDHVEHIAEVAERASPFNRGRAHVALGSDADGGFPASRLAAGIDRPRDFEKLADELSRRGWGDDDVAGFKCGNWMRVFGSKQEG